MKKPTGHFLKFFIFLAVSLSALTACDTEYDPHYWGKTFDYSDGTQSVYAAKPTHDGGYIVTGTVSINRGDQMDMGDIWAARLNSEGNLLWQRVISGSALEIGIDGMDVIPTDNGEFIISCRSNSFDSVYSPWILKLDENGNILWQKNYSNGEYTTAKSMIKTADGGCLLLAGASSTAELIKLASDGSIQWSRACIYQDGTVFQDIESVALTPDGGYIISGAICPTEPEGTNNIYRDAVIIKLDAEGNMEWKKEISGYQVFNSINAIRPVTGGYIGVGSTSVPGSVGNRDFFLISFDSEGEVLWQKKFDLNGSGEDEFTSLVIAEDGTCLAAGNTDGYDAGDIVITCFNTDGSAAWTKIYDAERCTAEEIQATVRGYLIGGYNGLGLLMSIDENGEIPNAGNRIFSVTPSFTETDFISYDRAMTVESKTRTVTDTDAVTKNISLSIENL